MFKPAVYVFFLVVKLLSDGVPQFSRIPLVDIPATLPPSPNEPELTETSSSQLSVTASTTTKPTIKTPEPTAEEKKGRYYLLNLWRIKGFVVEHCVSEVGVPGVNLAFGVVIVYQKYC